MAGFLWAAVNHFKTNDQVEAKDFSVAEIWIMEKINKWILPHTNKHQWRLFHLSDIKSAQNEPSISTKIVVNVSSVFLLLTTNALEIDTKE